MVPSFLRARTIGAWLALVLLASCGGGGGGGDTPAVAPLTVANVQSAGTTQEAFSGADPFQPVTVTADVQGDLSQLAGGTIYVVVEDPDGLFMPQPTVQVSSNGVGNRLTILPRQSNDRVGTFTGPLRVSVCRDAACAQPLRGSPFTVAYRLQVLPRLGLAQEGDLLLQGTFGGTAAPLSTNVQLPGGATEFAVSLELLSGVRDGLVTASRDGTAVVLTPQLAAPGEHQYTLTVTASGRTSAGRVVPMTVTRRVRYTVAANPNGNWLATPAVLNLTFPYNGAGAVGRVEVLSADGEIYDALQSIDYARPVPSNYLNAPGPWLYVQSAGGAAFRGSVDVGARACAFGAPGVDPCLVPGQYFARVLLRSRSGGIAPSPIDVVLTVTP